MCDAAAQFVSDLTNAAQLSASTGGHRGGWDGAAFEPTYAPPTLAWGAGAF